MMEKKIIKYTLSALSILYIVHVTQPASTCITSVTVEILAPPLNTYTNG